MDESVQKNQISKFLKVRMAIVEVGMGETNEEAWLRHLTSHPEDHHVDVRIFNYPHPGIKPRNL